METLDHILAAITPGCFMTILDLSDAYLTIPVFRAHQKFLKFSWLGKLYMYVVLPFGLTSAPRLFTKILKPLVAHLRCMGHTVIFYLDDGWQCGQSYGECLQACEATYSLMVSCGFLPNISKSSLIPKQRLSVLGFILNSAKMTISLDTQKEKHVMELLQLSLTTSLSIRQVARLISKLISIM